MSTSDHPHDQQKPEALAFELTLEELGIDPNAYKRPATPEEVLALIDQWPFLQITNTNFNPDLQHDVQVQHLQSGWRALDYGNGLATSPGRLAFGDIQATADANAIKTSGTIVKQAFDSALELIQMARARKWEGIRIVDGHPRMLQALWIGCSEQHVSLEGYTPEEGDYFKYTLLKRTPEEVAQLISLNKPSPRQ